MTIDHTVRRACERAEHQRAAWTMKRSPEFGTGTHRGGAGEVCSLVIVSEKDGASNLHVEKERCAPCPSRETRCSVCIQTGKMRGLCLVVQDVYWVSL